MTISVGVFEAKTRLSELLDKAQGGEEIVITRRGEPIACLRRVESSADQAQRTIDGLRAIRARTRPGTSSIRELIEEGRRYP